MSSSFFLKSNLDNSLLVNYAINLKCVKWFLENQKQPIQANLINLCVPRFFEKSKSRIQKTSNISIIRIGFDVRKAIGTLNDDVQFLHSNLLLQISFMNVLLFLTCRKHGASKRR